MYLIARQREQELKSSSTGKGGPNKVASKKLSNATKKTISARESSLSAPKSTQKDKKAAARAVIRETRAASKNIAQKKRIAQAEEDEASDLDYGSEDNDDSDEDYDEKPWAMKKATEVIKESSKVASSQKDSDDMEVDDKNEESPMAVSRTFVEADYADYKMVIIPRRRLIRWCHEPFFDKAVENYYVRIMIGNDPMTQKPLYKLSKIMKVDPNENTEYEFPAEPGKPPVCFFLTCALCFAFFKL
jgi:RNA polymerase-associated protein RTF1